MGIPFPLLPELKYVDPNSQMELGPTMLSTYKGMRPLSWQLRVSLSQLIPLIGFMALAAVGATSASLYFLFTKNDVMWDLMYFIMYLLYIFRADFLDPNKPSTVQKHFCGDSQFIIFSPG